MAVTDIQWLNTLLNILGVLLGGGALGVILNYRHKMKQLEQSGHSTDREADRVDFNLILAEVRSQRDEAHGKVAELENRVESMEAEIVGLRLAHDLDPFPNWIVGAADLTYMYVNREFERYFLLPIGKDHRSLIGKRHEDFWPEPFCRTLYALDAAAKTRPDGRAKAVTVIDVPRLGSSKITVHKFPVRAQPSGAILGYAGYITDIEPEGERLGGANGV